MSLFREFAVGCFACSLRPLFLLRMVLGPPHLPLSNLRMFPQSPRGSGSCGLVKGGAAVDKYLTPSSHPSPHKKKCLVLPVSTARAKAWPPACILSVPSVHEGDHHVTVAVQDTRAKLGVRS